MSWEREIPPYPHLPVGEFFRDSGLFRVRFSNDVEIAGVSTGGWDEYVRLLGDISPSDKYVVSPEMMTCADMDFEVMDEELINERIDEVIDISKRCGNTYFLLGTPLFINEKPRNSVVVIKNGEIESFTSKRCGATELENKYFEMVPEEVPVSLPETDIPIVICSDLALASIYSACEPNTLEQVLKISGREMLIGKKVDIVPGDAESILVVACWSVGGRFVEEETKDKYYKNQLIGICASLMKKTNVQEVIMVDRLPAGLAGEKMRLTPTRPCNGVVRVK